jgi:hypothetical protein
VKTANSLTPWSHRRAILSAHSIPMEQQRAAAAGVDCLEGPDVGAPLCRRHGKMDS